MDRKQWIRTVMECSQLRQAQMIDEELSLIGRQTKVNCDVFLYNQLIAMYGRCGSPVNARRIFDSMDEKDSFSWDFMFVAYLSNDCYSGAATFFRQMPLLNVVSATSMMCAHAQNGHLDEAKVVFDQMQQRSLVSWNAMASAFARGGHLEQTAALFSTMPVWNVVSWTVFLQACDRSRNFSIARKVFHSMPEWDLICATAILSAMSTAGDLEQCKAIFDSSPEQDLALRNAMLHAYCHAGMIEDAERCFVSMDYKDTVSWNSMLSVYAEHRDLLKAQHIFSVMPVRDRFSWSILLQVLVAVGHTDTYKFFFEMPDRDEIAWNTALAANAQTGHSTYALEMFDTMKLVAEVPPDAGCFVSVLTALSREGKLSRTRHCFTSMASDFGISPGKSHYCCVIDALCRGGRPKDAAELMITMPFAASALEWRVFLAATGGLLYMAPSATSGGWRSPA